MTNISEILKPLDVYFDFLQNLLQENFKFKKELILTMNTVKHHSEYTHTRMCV